MKNLNEMNRKDLLEITKEMGLKGCSRMKKEQLIELIQEQQAVVQEVIQEVVNQEAVVIETIENEVTEVEVTESTEVETVEEVTSLIHISRKELALMRLAKRQSKLQLIDNGLIVVPVKVENEVTEEVIAQEPVQKHQEPTKETTIVETIETLYEKHYTNANKKGGKKGGDLYVAPAKELKPIKEGSKVHRFVQKMIYGATIEDLCEITPNPKSVRVYFSYDLKLKGYGVKQIDDRYYIIFPDGVLEPLIAQKAIK